MTQTIIYGGFIYENVYNAIVNEVLTSSNPSAYLDSLLLIFENISRAIEYDYDGDINEFIENAWRN